MKSVSTYLVLSLLWLCDLTIAHAQSIQDDSTIVLRNLTTIRDAKVSEFDAAGLLLTNGDRLQWDEVLSAPVPKDRQAEFNEYLKSVGEPLFRLKTRLRNKDWSGAGELGETLYEPIRTRPSPNQELDFAIGLAVMRGRLFKGDRAGAVESFLLAASIQQKLNDASRKSLDDLLLPAVDVENQISNQIIPHWFDTNSIAAANDSVRELIEIGRIQNVRGVAVYLASLAVARKDYSESDRLISKLRGKNDLTSSLDNWLTVIEIERYFAANEQPRADQLVKQSFNRLSGGPRALVFYLRGTYATDGPEKQLLSLLTVPAVFGERFPNLSATALYRASLLVEKQGISKDARILRNELLRRYPNTYHGRLARNEQN